MKTRTEIDALGSVQVPSESYGGSFTARALANFKISNLKAPDSFRVSLALIKMAAAEVNAALGHLPKKSAAAIVQAGEEFLDGKFDADFQLDVYQAGAGTPFNMNLNEILANRASELLGGKKGEYKRVHPNNHVNMSQSSNDVIPTAIRLAALMDLGGLVVSGLDLIEALEKKAKKFEKILKVGRTHLQDAVPVTLGQEFKSYASALEHALERLDFAAEELTYTGIGATATGSGINTHPKFTEKMRKNLSRRLDIEFQALNPFENNNSMAVFASVSGALRGLASEVLRMSDDLRLLSSGAFAEIQLPEVEPGSSIMPGKVNPSVLECVSMICVQSMAMDHAIALAAQRGQLELNWYTPLIMFDLLHAIEIMTQGFQILREHCIEGIEANASQMKIVLENSTAMATALAPVLGYHEVAEWVKESKAKKIPFVKKVPEKYKKLIALENLVHPNRT
ncbi:aspartate ammonia-lyase [Candidatus Peregrinibacteria bacterium]|nr:MAG: aspartate ammonia-lyase [Candidatus Peregrinibacteria bacterium]